MSEPSSLFFIGTAVASLISGVTYAPEAGQPAWFGNTVHLEKLYAEGGKIVATPMMDVVEAFEKCPKGYVVRREGSLERDGQTILTWTLNCQ